MGMSTSCEEEIAAEVLLFSRESACVLSVCRLQRSQQRLLKREFTKRDRKRSTVKE